MCAVRSPYVGSELEVRLAIVPVVPSNAAPNVTIVPPTDVLGIGYGCHTGIDDPRRVGLVNCVTKMPGEHAMCFGSTVVEVLVPFLSFCGLHQMLGQKRA